MNAINRAEMNAFILDELLHPAAVTSAEVLEVFTGRHFGVDYQPVVDIQGGDIAGYHAGARFWTAQLQGLNGAEVYSWLYKNPLLLLHTELEIKKRQIAQFPGDGWLMVDLDVDSFIEGGEDLGNPFIQLFRQHIWSEQELIANVIDRQPGLDGQRGQRVIELLQLGGIAVALEDAGIHCGMFSLGAFLDASMIKFNGLALRALNETAAQATVSWLVSAARRIGVQTVMSGVSNCDQLEWARRLGVDAVQGSLFTRQSIQLRCQSC